MLKINRNKTTNEEDMHEVHPSPVLKSRFNFGKPTHSIDNCHCKQCNEMDFSRSEPGEHHDRCGCHICFMNDSKEAGQLNKEKLRNIIKNFLSRKDNLQPSENLETHPKNCMCIGHLHYYRNNKIHILDNFLKTENKNISKSNDSLKPEKKTENQNQDLNL